jgi:hypothetical protein
MQQTHVLPMQKVKEEVIMRILVQESLNLELWLERYEVLGAILWFFSRARDFSRIIFQKPWVSLQKFQTAGWLPKRAGAFFQDFQITDE